MLFGERKTIPVVGQHDAAIPPDGVQPNDFKEAVSRLDFQIRCVRPQAQVRKESLQAHTAPARGPGQVASDWKYTRV